MNKPTIIFLSGKKHAGKNTLARWAMVNKTEIFGQKFIDCQEFAFAAELKFFCRDFFEIPFEDMHSAEGKNKPTRYKWSDLPGVVVVPQESFRFKDTKNVRYYYGEDRCLTVREFLQEVGTGVMRTIFDNVWINKLKKNIHGSLDNIAKAGHNYHFPHGATVSPVYFITDWRYPNEYTDFLTDPFFNSECKLITVRLTRDTNDPNDPSTKHSSETSLDEFLFDKVVDNAKLTLNETKYQFAEFLKSLTA